MVIFCMQSLGPAPKWCGFLDSLVEELQETKKETVYDDYRFATRNELEELGLSHLIGKIYVLFYLIYLFYIFTY